MIETVTGPIPLEKLGQTLIHEHIICSGAEFQLAFPNWRSREAVLDTAVTKLKYVSEKFQVRTVIDGTPLTLGRDLELLKEASIRSGVQIVASTGFYYYDSFAVQKIPVEKMAELLAGEVRKGPIRPAMFKCAADSTGITETVRKTLQTAGAVFQAVGIPVYCHSNSWTRSGLEAQQVLEDSGVPPAKTVIGHVSDSNDIDYALELLNRGCFVSLDRVCGHNAAFAAELVRQGFEERIFLSHDHICCCDEMVLPQEQYDPHGLDIVHSRFLPEMRKLGVSEESIEKITTKNIISLYRDRRV